ncbi:hypothetical protein GOBAR_AA31612 [Gossypium barbadense]|uniref:DUF4283 domain-containing protein n=1 Tax=Gossypium barbadense TaxID=3634 RepID=A0A2P5WDA7_GOSBA|nr:hypothetical protein GOBAR_AA31612 [Gossypium barbadense]
MSYLVIGNVSKSRSAVDRETKKVRFKEDNSIADVEMIGDVVSPSKDLVSPAKISWKIFETYSTCPFQGYETSVALKLLGRNIGYIALFNQISSLWRSSKSFNLMDIENGYFLAKFQSIEDYNKVLVIYGQYLIVQPWTKYFNPMKPYPSMVLAWIRLPGLSDLCPSLVAKKSIMVEEVNGNKDLAELTTAGWGFAFRPWMVVKRKARVIRGKRFKENLDWGRDFRC